MNLAHRGASEYAPENTMAAFYKGVELGANGIETDLKASKDGVIFLFHDDVLDRTTDGSGLPADYTWAELQRLDAGSWFSPKYAGERLVSLEQFLHFFGRKRLHFALELKDRGIAAPVLQAIERHGVRDRTTITSFSYENLQEVRALDDSIRIGYLLREIDREAIAKLQDIGGQQICPAASALTREAVQTAKQCGLQVRAWGVADVELMRHALACGADGMTVNFPDLLAAELKADSG